MKAELGAKIGDQFAFGQVRRVFACRRCAVGIVGREHARHGAEEDRIRRRLFEPMLVDTLQESLGAVADGAPEFAAQAGEQGPRRPIPAVPEVIRQLVESCQPGGQLGIDF